MITRLRREVASSNPSRKNKEGGRGVGGLVQKSRQGTATDGEWAEMGQVTREDGSRRGLSGGGNRGPGPDARVDDGEILCLCMGRVGVGVQRGNFEYRVSVPTKWNTHLSSWTGWAKRPPTLLGLVLFPPRNLTFHDVCKSPTGTWSRRPVSTDPLPNPMGRRDGN